MNSIIGYETLLIYPNFVEGVWILSDYLNLYAIKTWWEKIEYLFFDVKCYMLISENTFKKIAMIFT